MDANKDYYGILGILPTAEDIVIRAAYKALAQRYHPDRAEDKESATKLLQELNEAYSILSDPHQRRKYDEFRGETPQAADSVFTEDAIPSGDEDDPLYRDWRVVVEIYPELKEIVANLDKMAFRLGYAFRANMLETKRFSDGRKIAGEMETKFIETYFGTNLDIHSFARFLIEIGRRDAAKTLNEGARIVGPKPDGQGVLGLLVRVIKKHDLQQYVRDIKWSLPTREELWKEHGIFH